MYIAPEVRLIELYKEFSTFNFYKELKLDKELDELVKLEENFSYYKFKIAVVGEFNKGKSSLINSLIGKNILPEGITPTTNQTVTISNSEKEYIKKGQDTFKLTKENMLRINQSDENFEVFAKFKQMDNFVFIDTAGTNDPSKLSDEIVFDLIGKVDITIFLLDTIMPLSSSELRFLSKLIRKKDLEKFFFVINKEDEKDENDKIEIRNYILDTLSKEFQIDKENLKNQIFLYSATNSQQNIEHSYVLVESINTFTKNSYDDLLKDLKKRTIREILEKSFIKLSYLLETLDGQNKDYEENLQEIIKEINSFKEKIQVNIEKFQDKFLSNKREYIDNVKESFIKIKETLKNEINNSKIEDLSQNRYVELRARKLIEDYLSEDSKTFIKGLNDNIKELDSHIKPIFDKTRININDISIKTRSSAIVKTIALLGTGALAISYAPTVLTVGGIGATIAAGATVAGVAFPAFLPFGLLISSFVVTLGKTIFDASKIVFGAGKWGVEKISGIASGVELELIKKRYVSSVENELENIKYKTIENIKNTFQSEEYIESYISDKFPEKDELEKKIYISKENVFKEINKLNDEKSRINDFIDLCNNIIKG